AKLEYPRLLPRCRIRAKSRTRLTHLPRRMWRSGSPTRRPDHLARGPAPAAAHIPDAVGLHSAGLALACVTSSLSSKVSLDWAMTGPINARARNALAQRMRSARRRGHAVGLRPARRIT